MSKHSKLSASSTARFLTCQRSVSLSSGVASEDSNYSVEGTTAHEILEDCLTDNRPADVRSDDIDEETAEAIQYMLDVVQEHLQGKEVLIRLIEERFKHSEIKGFGGTCDLAVVYRDYNTETLEDTTYIHVFDYKHGVGDKVEVRGNMQGLSYACLIRDRFGGLVDVDAVKITIVQPRVFTGASADTWEVSTKTLDEHEEAIKAIDPENGPIVAGDHCRYCPALKICPEVHRLTVKASTDDPARETTEELLEMKKAEPAIKAYFRRLDMILVARHEESPIPGKKVVMALGNRRFKGGAEAMKEVFRKLRIRKDLWMTNVEKMKTPKQVMEELTDKQREKIDAYIERPEVGLRLVDESDRREAHDPNKLVNELFNDETSNG